MIRPRLSRKALSGLNMMATLSDSWREADEDENLSARDVAELECASAWLQKMTAYHNAARSTRTEREPDR